MAALDLDFLQRVVNVQWGGGLAVEFSNEPSYLKLDNALSMNKVIISVWFRVPTEAAEAVRATEGEFWEYQVFQNVIPIITWGPQQYTPVTTVQRIDTGAMEGTGGGIIAHGVVPIIIDQIGAVHTAPLQPSCIGVNVGAINAPLTVPLLHVHIQTDVMASGNGLHKIQSAFTGTFVGNDVDTGKPVYGGVEYTEVDVSYIITEEPEYLGNSSSNVTFSGAGTPEVILDRWHHLLISWELRSHSNLGGACKMWCAIDNKNKDGNDLPAMNDSSKMPPNDHMSGMCFAYEGNTEAFVSVNFGSNDVPSNPFQSPGPRTADRASDDSGGVIAISPIQKVELAELQIFSGVTLDTSSETNRRAFIDFERDADGNPIVDEDGMRNLKPVNPKQAEELLGQRPDILLHGTRKWQDGKNTGALGIDDEGEQVPDGQFKPTGEIKKYTPDPSIVEL